MKSKIAFSMFLLLILLSLTRLLPRGSAESPQQDMATPVQRGVMTETQKEHSRLYKKYDTPRKIPDLVRTEKDDVEVYRLLPLGADLSGGPEPTVSEMLKRVTCNSNAVVIGTVKYKASQLTESESFVFTDYAITVKEVLKNNELAPIGTGEINVTRPGGTIILNGKIVRALDELFKPLTVGQEYILFLRFLPKTGAYLSIKDGESFQLWRNKEKSLREESLDRSVTEYTTESLRNEVRNAAATPCSGNKGNAQ